MRWTVAIRLWCSFALLAIAALWPAGPATAQTVKDYMVQMVCVNSSDLAVAADPYMCPTGTTARKLKVGEKLPYHKIDYGNFQISDSFPILAPGGQIKSVQSYFFVPQIGVTDPTVDPRFAGAPYFNMLNGGGYNILASDGSYLSFEGTFDFSGGWQPWWKANCQKGGWLLMPDVSISSFTAGYTSSPTDHYPDCPGNVYVNTASTVVWDHYPSRTFAANKTLDTLVAFHFAGSYSGPLEVTYLTKEYGVTRFEGWLPDPTATASAGTMAQCPNSLYATTFYGTRYYLADCRDWSTVVTNLGNWDPAGTAANDANVLTWPVDPLYTTGNLLKNTHFGGPYSNYGSTYCDVAQWTRTTSPSPVLNWAWDSSTGTPFTAAGNCALIFSTPSPVTGSALLNQLVSIPANSNGDYTFGATLWSPGLASTASPVPLKVFVLQLDSSGNQSASIVTMTANLTGLPATFSNSFQMNANTVWVGLYFWPQVGGVNHELTGAWIARKP